MRFGIYIFRRGDVVLYVGMSLDLVGRIAKQIRRFPGCEVITHVGELYIGYETDDVHRSFRSYQMIHTRFRGLVIAKVFVLAPPKKKFVETPTMKLKVENIELRRLVKWMLDLRTAGHGPAQWDDAAREILGKSPAS